MGRSFVRTFLTGHDNVKRVNNLQIVVAMTNLADRLQKLDIKTGTVPQLWILSARITANLQNRIAASE